MLRCVVIVFVCLVACSEDRSSPAPGYVVPQAGEFAAQGTTGGTVVSIGGIFSLEIVPEPSPIPFNEPYALAIDVARAASPDVLEPDATLQLTARMPEHNHGMNRYPVVERVGPGRFRASGMLFHMSGFWELVVNVQAGDEQDQAVMRIDLE